MKERNLDIIVNDDIRKFIEFNTCLNLNDMEIKANNKRLLVIYEKSSGFTGVIFKIFGEVGLDVDDDFHEVFRYNKFLNEYFIFLRSAYRVWLNSFRK